MSSNNSGDSVQSMNDASEQIFCDVNDSLSKAKGLPGLIGNDAAMGLVAESFLNTEGLEDGSHRQEIRGEHAATAARFIHSMLRSSGAQNTERMALPDDEWNLTDRQVTCTLPTNEEERGAILEKYQKSAEWLSVNKEQLIIIFTAANLADRERVPDQGTKIIPSVIETATGNSFSLTIMTNEQGLVDELENRNFIGKKIGEFNRSDREPMGQGIKYSVSGDKVNSALEAVSIAFAPIGIAMNRRNLKDSDNPQTPQKRLP